MARTFSHLFVVYAVLAVVLIALLMPPFQAADELNHAERADQISLGTLVAERGGDGNSAGGIVHGGLSALATPFDPVRFHPKVKIDGNMRATETTGWGGPLQREFSNTAIYPPIFYAPAAVGLSIGRVLRFSVWHTVILARLLTGLVSVAIAAVAIARADRFAPLLFTALSLPMCLGLFAAISQDGPMIACAALGSMLLMRGGSDRAWFWAGCLLVAMVSMARPVYLPLCIVPMLAPNRYARAAGGAVVLGATLGWDLLVHRMVIPVPALRHVAQQIAAIRHDPHLPILLLHTTLNRELVEGFPTGREFIGVLGWLDTTLPDPYYALTGLMLLLATLYSGSPVPRRTMAVGLLSITTSAAAVYAAQYLSWSQIGSPFIDGVQGRYFLPLVPFLVFVIPLLRERLPRLVESGLRLYPCLTIALTVRAILIRYYLG